MALEGMKRLEQAYISKIGKRSAEIKRYIWTEAVPITDFALAETKDHLPITAAKELTYKKTKPGDLWGRIWGTGWFRLRFAIPKAFKGQAVSLLFNTNAEGLLYRDDLPVQGLEGNRQDYALTPKARGGETFELYCEVGVNNAFGGFERRAVGEPRVVVYLPEVWQAYWDLTCLFDVMEALPPEDTRRAKLVYELAKAVDLFDYQDLSRDALRSSARRLSKALKPLYEMPAAASAQTIACMGHAHIDVAWLWPLAETRRKNGRTFSNVLEYMDQYPDYIFCQSQPQLYEYAKENYPSLYKRIQAKVKKGQWIPTGCWWVEADCNVTSGESLVRQTLFGTRFFEQEFGMMPVCLWLPDVFGYAAAIPQILKRSGIDNFLTQKISWNQFTHFPHHSFRWQGIDGTEVLTHFPPADTYNGNLHAKQMKAAEKHYQQKDRSDIQAIPFGFGDGGGGPTKDMLERLRRYKDLEGMPHLEPMSTGEFFQRLGANADELPVWVGELYLELHRATLTTQGANKRGNRKSELALRDAEMINGLNLSSRGNYPQQELNEAWKKVLLNQFHDIIPGSSITLVYEDSDKDYAEVLDTAATCKQKGLQHYLKTVDTTGDGHPVVLFNSLSWERNEVAAVEIAGLKPKTDYIAVAPDGRETPAQVGFDGLVRFRATVPSVGHAVYQVRPGKVKAPRITASKKAMENDALKLAFDRRGNLRSVRDKANSREVLAGSGNEFQLFEDKPSNWDAWDVDIHYFDKLLELGGRLLELKVLEEGPVRAVVEIKRAVSKSTITQLVVLNAGSARVDFETMVDWADEKDVFLKVAFPVDIHADKARYEIQYGSVERPTHWNTPQDFGRFEVCAQKWADLTEGDYGVALLNDCKYGHDIRGNLMRLSLLRAPKHPDPQADINKQHVFTYSLMPHADDFRNGVVREGYNLNVPLTAIAAKASAGAAGAVAGLFGVSAENVVIDAIKKAEDDDGLIVRFYEAHGTRGSCTISTTLPYRKVSEVNLMEKVEKKLSLRHGKVRLTVKPYQIRTLKFE